MITIDKTEVFGWEAAIRGLRNPMNSWDKSDSGWFELEDWQKADTGDTFQYRIGENDLALMKKLSKAGSDHAKFLRMINVTVDITAPLYWWKEFDTYKVGTVANSCSTMHTIHKKEFTLDDFSCEHLYPLSIRVLEKFIIPTLNADRRSFLGSGNKDDWWQMIQLLPSSYNQKRTVQLNYQALKNMYHARKNHKLDEWRTLCEWAKGLPYFKEICFE